MLVRVEDLELAEPHAGERGERDALEHREHGGVQADAEREHAERSARSRFFASARMA